MLIILLDNSLSEYLLDVMMFILHIYHPSTVYVVELN